MGIHYSPLVVDNSQIFSNAYTQGDAFIRFIRDKVVDAGWVQSSKIMATITFTAFAIASGNTITLDGNVFTFYDTVPTGSNPVFRGSNNLDAITNLGPVVLSVLNWTYVIGGSASNPTITWTVEDSDPGDDDLIGNLLACSASPAGGIGVFDNNAENIAGTGRTWGGGFVVRSQEVLGAGRLVLELVTDIFINLTFRAPIKIRTANGFGTFDLNPNQTSWRIIANRYQFALLVPGASGAGTFFLASHMYPAQGFVYANYITGPVNIVSPSGGDRANFQDIGGEYYVDVGLPYQSSNTGTNATNPALCMPGYGSGQTPTQKLSNRLAGLNILKDDGNGYPFDAWVAACTESGLFADDFAHLGMLWDAAIYSVYALEDAVVDIDGDAGVVLLSQPGATANSRGSLVLLTETHV